MAASGPSSNRVNALPVMNRLLTVCCARLSSLRRRNNCQVKAASTATLTTACTSAGNVASVKRYCRKDVISVAATMVRVSAAE